MRKEGSRSREVLKAGMPVLGVISLALIGMRGCAEAYESPPDRVIEFVEDAGYSDVTITGVDKIPNIGIFRCLGETNVVLFEVDATFNATGERNDDLFVCNDIFKELTLHGN